MWRHDMTWHEAQCSSVWTRPNCQAAILLLIPHIHLTWSSMRMLSVFSRTPKYAIIAGQSCPPYFVLSSPLRAAGQGRLGGKVLLQGLAIGGLLACFLMGERYTREMIYLFWLSVGPRPGRVMVLMCLSVWLWVCLPPPLPYCKAWNISFVDRL